MNAATAGPAGRTVVLRGQLASSRLKLTTVRSTWIVAIVALLIELALRLVSAAVLDPAAPAADTIAALRPSIAAAALIGLLPLLLASSEWRYGTAVLTFAAMPDRRLVLAATALVAAVTGAVAGAVLSGVGLVAQVGVIAARGIPTPPGVLTAGLGAVAGAALLGATAAGLGLLVRDQVAALGVLATLFFVLPLPLLLVAPGAYALTPSGLLDSLAGQRIALPALLPWPGAALVLAALTAACLTLAAVVLERRDVA